MNHTAVAQLAFDASQRQMDKAALMEQLQALLPHVDLQAVQLPDLLLARDLAAILEQYVLASGEGTDGDRVWS